MSGALMNKVWDLFGMDSAEPEEYEDETTGVKVKYTLKEDEIVNFIKSSFEYKKNSSIKNWKIN